MKTFPIALQVVLPKESRHALSRWIRTARQRAEWTQAMLSSKSGVPVATLSRFEREGHASIDAVARMLQALGELDGFHAYVQERILLASLPNDLAQLPIEPRIRQRVRTRKASGRGTP